MDKTKIQINPETGRVVMYYADIIDKNGESLVSSNVSSMYFTEEEAVECVRQAWRKHNMCYTDVMRVDEEEYAFDEISKEEYEEDALDWHVFEKDGHYYCIDDGRYEFIGDTDTELSLDEQIPLVKEEIKKKLTEMLAQKKELDDETYDLPYPLDAWSMTVSTNVDGYVDEIDRFDVDVSVICNGRYVSDRDERDVDLVAIETAEQYIDEIINSLFNDCLKDSHAIYDKAEKIESDDFYRRLTGSDPDDSSAWYHEQCDFNDGRDPYGD